MFAYTGQNRFYGFTHAYFYSYVSAHSYPFLRLTPPLSPSSGDGFLCESFPYFSVLLTLFSFFRFCSNLPLPSTCRLTPSPCPGTAFWLHTSISPTSGNNSRFIFFPFFLVSGAACAFVFLFYCQEIFILRNKKDPLRGLFRYL